MNTKHAQCTCLYIQLVNVTKPYTYGSSCSRLHVQLHSVILSTVVIKLIRQCYPALANKSHLKTDGGPVRWMTVFQDHLCNDPTEGFL